MYRIDVDEQVYTALRERGRTGDTFNGSSATCWACPVQSLADPYLGGQALDRPGCCAPGCCTPAST